MIENVRIVKHFSQIRTLFYWLESFTAISINVVRLKLQAYATRLNGGLGVHWNLHTCVDENYKFSYLCVKPKPGWRKCVSSQE